MGEVQLSSPETQRMTSTKPCSLPTTRRPCAGLRERLRSPADPRPRLEERGACHRAIAAAWASPRLPRALERCLGSFSRSEGVPAVFTVAPPLPSQADVSNPWWRSFPLSSGADSGFRSRRTSWHRWRCGWMVLCCGAVPCTAGGYSSTPGSYHRRGSGPAHPHGDSQRCLQAWPVSPGGRGNHPN